MDFNTGERILAIDFGEKRIGLAITDPLRLFAQPLITLQNDNKFWKNLQEIFLEYDIKLILLGYPLKENGEKSSVADKVETFYKSLKKRTTAEILYRDERYTSGIATQRIIETVKSKKKRRDKSLVDKTAAAVILEEYLSETCSG